MFVSSPNTYSGTVAENLTVFSVQNEFFIGPRSGLSVHLLSEQTVAAA